MAVKLTEEEYRTIEKNIKERGGSIPEEVVDIELEKFKEKKAVESAIDTSYERKSKKVKEEEEPDTPSEFRSVFGGFGTHVGRKIKEKASGIVESVKTTAYKPFESEVERTQRAQYEEEESFRKATYGMTPSQKKVYRAEKERLIKEKAKEEARHKYTIPETYEEKQKRLKKKRERAEEVAHAYRTSRAHAEGSAAGKPPKAIDESKRTIAPENPMLGMGGLVPHGFMPPGQGVRALGFEPYIPPQEPQPERQMSKRELLRQKSYEISERFKREQQQKFMQSQGVTLEHFTAPPKNIGNPLQMFMPQHQTSNGMGRKQQEQPKMYNPFETHQMREHNPQMIQTPRKEPQMENSLMKGVFDHSELNNAPRQQYKPQNVKLYDRPDAPKVNRGFKPQNDLMRGVFDHSELKPVSKRRR